MTEFSDLPQLAAGYNYVLNAARAFVIDANGAFVIAQGVGQEQVSGEVGGASISGGTFSRGRWRALKREWELQDRAEAKAAELRQRRERDVLAAAAQAARRATHAAERSEAAVELQVERMNAALRGAVDAASLRDIFRQSQAALDCAAEIMALIERERQYDEDEALVLLLLN